MIRVTPVNQQSVVLSIENRGKVPSSPKLEAVALPVIASIGNQAKTVGDSAAPGCGVCWVACLANPVLVPVCATVCAAMCVSPLKAE